MKFSKLVLLMALATLMVMTSYEALAAKGNETSPTSPTTVDPKKAEKDAEKAAKEAAKLLEKQQKDADKAAEKALKDAEKAAKKADRIELRAKMKAEESEDETVDAPVSEDEASLKYRSRSGKLKLTAEVEGFTDGQIVRMYVVINNAEVLVTSLELIGEGDIPRQEIEFDETTWPTGVPTVLTAGTVVRLRDAQGVLLLESSLQPK